MRRWMNRMAAAVAAFIFCSGTAIAAFAAGSEQAVARSPRLWWIPALAALALLGLALMLLIANHRFRRHGG